MEVMIENSNAFVIFPGGAGTVQELLDIFDIVSASVLQAAPS